MARSEVMPILEEEYKKLVDEMTNIELENMKMFGGFGKKKKKKGKKKKKKGGGKKKGMKGLPGYKNYINTPTEELLQLLINQCIVKKLPP